MKLLIAGLIVFYATHLVPALPTVKANLLDRLGRGAYMGLFSVLASAGLAIIVWGYAQADWVTVYEPAPWGRHVTMLFVLLALICLSAFSLKGRIRKALRHPMSIGIMLWATGHLFANGDLASVLLFGSFVTYGLTNILLANARGPVDDFDVKPTHDLIAAGAGTAIYVVLIALHPYVIGVAVI